MRQYIYNLKKQLTLGNVYSFVWTPTEYQLANVLTKEEVNGDMLDGIIIKNRCKQVADRHNEVTWDGMEMRMTGKTLRDRVVAKPNKTMRKKAKSAAK